MAKVADIERVRVDRLADELLPAIRDAFTGPGMLKAATADIEDVERWRRAARACARQLGVTCSTSVSADGTFVWIVDTSPATFPDQVRARRSIGRLLNCGAEVVLASPAHAVEVPPRSKE